MHNLRSKYLIMYLNFLQQVELDIAFFAQKLGDTQTSEKFLKASKARQFAMKSIFWNAEMNQWLDYWLSSSDCEVFHQTLFFRFRNYALDQ